MSGWWAKGATAGRGWQIAALGVGSLFASALVIATHVPEARAAASITKIAAGGDHSMLLKSDGTLWTFGYNYLGQLGTGTNNLTSNPNPTPTQVMTGVAAMAAGSSHSLVLKTDGTLWTFGSNRYGQLGKATNSATGEPNTTPTQVMTGVATMAAGEEHSLVLKTDGSLWSFGLNRYGQLGITVIASPGDANPTPTVAMKASQSVSFVEPYGPKVFGDADFSVAASATSGLAVTITSDTTDVCTVVAGPKVHIVSVGLCTIRAEQAGDASYGAATPVTQNITISAASQSVSFDDVYGPKVFGDADFFVAASASSGLAVTITSDTTDVCTVVAGPKVHIVSGGLCTIRAEQAGNASYSAATPVTQNIPVNGRRVTVPGGVAAFSTSTGAVCSAEANSLPLSPPSNLEFPYGALSFTICGLPVGGSANITIALPGPVSQFWKHQHGAWHRVVGATFSDNNVTYTLTDGGADDEDGIANGVIVDPGAPARLAPTPPTTTTPPTTAPPTTAPPTTAPPTTAPPTTAPPTTTSPKSKPSPTTTSPGSTTPPTTAATPTMTTTPTLVTSTTRPAVEVEGERAARGPTQSIDDTSSHWWVWLMVALLAVASAVFIIAVRRGSSLPT